MSRSTIADDVRIWGYRNVWFRFHPSEANVYVPVSLNMLSVMESAFLNTFVSQREASFPSYAHDGPFCELAQQIQVDQYQMLKTCLGRAWFAEHSSRLIRGARGFVFLREMNISEFRQTARSLAQVDGRFLATCHREIENTMLISRSTVQDCDATLSKTRGASHG